MKRGSAHSLPPQAAEASGARRKAARSPAVSSAPAGLIHPAAANSAVQIWSIW